MKQNNIKLALETEKGLREAKLVPDPDGSDGLWFEGTGRDITLEGRVLLTEEKQNYTGKCIDTAEYYSPAGNIANEFLSKAPRNADLMVFSFQEWVGTQTYGGEAIARYYSEKREEGSDHPMSLERTVYFGDGC